MLNIIDVGFDSTHYYVLAPPRSRAGGTESTLLIDVGWPGTLPRLRHNLERADIPFAQITHLLITHYHPDHAGAAQELKDRGVKLILMEGQADAIPLLRSMMRPRDNYVPIMRDDNLDLRFADSRAFLHWQGIEGEIIATPGHSDDSVSLLLDTGEAFTGDLPPEFAAQGPDDPIALSWAAVRARGGKKVYPGHGPVGQEI